MSCENVVSIVIDAISAAATIAAVVVALLANRKATKQLKSALEMQEQSKNVELMDRRIALTEDIQKGKSVSELELRILFDNEIFNCYKKWRNYLEEEKSAISDQEIFRMLVMQAKIDGEIPNTMTGAIGNRPSKTYDISEIRERLKNANNDMEFEHKKLLQLLESYISNSIRSISKV